MSCIVLVATAGGHLGELNRLRHRLPDAGLPTVWISTDHPHSRSLLANEKAYFMPKTVSRDLGAVLRNARLMRPILKEHRPVRVVSNGASLALSALIQAAWMGIRADYIESSVRVFGPSMSGKILSFTPRLHTHTQYQSWSSRRWPYAGSILDNWDAGPQRAAPLLRRVVVTVGTESWQFRALFEKLVRLLPKDAEVLWQSGSTPIDGLGIRGLTAVPPAELGQAMAAADLVIAHSGIGSALTALDHGKVPLLIPRRAERKEAVDNHQIEIGNELQRRGLCTFCELDDLDGAVIGRALQKTAQVRKDVPKLVFS
ncbi:MAG: glycosyl transferase family 28 [Planctomycetes bacterium]|nr:glycosyl transferase family 28 [Planctomycetota bacterium]